MVKYQLGEKVKWNRLNGADNLPLNYLKFCLKKNECDRFKNI